MASPTISGPMPSPGRITIFILRVPYRSTEQPRLLELPLRFKRADLVGVAERETDVVPSVDEALLAERVDLEGHLFAIGLDHALPRQVDREPVAGERGDLRKQPVDLGFRKHQRQQAVLEAVVEEDI